MLGTELKKGDTVTIVLSKGPMKGNIPNIVGLTLAEAENILKENKLTLGNIKYEYSDTYNNGIVIYQDPKSGTESNQEWGTVNVTVSKGPRPEEPVQPPIEDTVPEPVQPPTSTTPDSNLNNNENTNDGSNSGATNNENNSSNENTNGDTNTQPEQNNENQNTQTDASEITENNLQETTQSE